jgi:hypothetical protein
MSSRKDKNGRFGLPRLSYTSRVHLRRRLDAIAAMDFRFIAAVAALAAATAAVTSYY